VVVVLEVLATAEPASPPKPNGGGGGGKFSTVLSELLVLLLIEAEELTSPLENGGGGGGAALALSEVELLDEVLLSWAEISADCIAALIRWKALARSVSLTLKSL